MAMVPENKNASNTGALFQEALRLHIAGKEKDAAALYQKIIKNDPRYAPALSNLAIIYLHSGERKKALSYIRKALVQDKASPSAHNTMGLILTGDRDYQKAEQAFLQALSLNPDYAEAYFNLARLFFLRREWKSTTKTTDELLKRNPAHQGGNILKLAARAELGLFEDLQDENIEKIFKDVSGNPFLLFLKGRVLFLSGQAEKALTELDKALAIDADYVLALRTKAAALTDCNKKEEAKFCIEKICSLDPSDIGALRLLVGANKVEEDSPVLAKLKLLEKKQQQLTAAEKTELYYALAKCYQDLEQPRDTFSYWKKAGQEKLIEEPYDFGAGRDYAFGIMDLFKSTPEQLKATNGQMSPIFIVGMPRSGTTLLEQILASHEEVEPQGELLFLKQAIGSLASYKEGLSINKAENISSQYHKWLSARSPDSRFVTDKMPYNYQYLGFIHAALPEAKIIHIMRNPMDVCLSNFSLLFRNGQGWSYDLETLAQYYGLYDDMMVHWRKVLPQGSFLDIRYEDLVAYTEENVRDVLEYCGLPWNEACLNFHRSERAIHTASAAQVKKPVYKSSIERWREYEEQLAPLRKKLIGIAEKNGYDIA